MATELSKRKCTSCTPETPPLSKKLIDSYFSQLDEGWKLNEQQQLEKTYRFKNFQQALEFTLRIGEMSEQEGHHPEITLSWGKVKTTIFTHVINDLSENDFIWAAKADLLYD